MGLIPQNFIDDLVSRADIVEIINSRVPLKKKGREYSACCPFHNEKTPSFTVSEVKQFYHCFGCGAHGTVLGFLMEYENLDFVDAVEALAAEYNLEVPRESSGNSTQTRPDNKQPLYDILEKVCQLFQDHLKKSEKSISYLKGRGLTGDIAKTWRLGYAPDGWNFLTEQFTGNEDINKLMNTGLLIKKDNGQYYDRFRDRIMFPITDRRGRVVGFGGRIIDQGEPKYLNSPENNIFHKGLELYGLYEARRATRKLERIVVVEGYMDVVALAQHDITYAVASLGTATTQQQIQKILRTVPEIIFCYDGDNAGRQAAWRALENTLPAIRDGLIARFMFVPEGEDPDSLVRTKGREYFESLIQQAMPLSDFLFESLQSDIDINTVDGKASLAKKATPLLQTIPESVFKDLLYEKLAQVVGITVEKLRPQVTAQNSNTKTQKNVRSLPAGRQISNSKTRVAIALLLQNPSLAKQFPVPEEFRTAITRGLALLFQLHETISQSSDITATALLERYRGSTEEKTLYKLYGLETEETKNTDNISKEYKQILDRLLEDERRELFELLTGRRVVKNILIRILLLSG